MEEINDILKRLINFPLTKDSGLLQENLASLDQRLTKKEFQLVVLGQFKRGKTSLINALISKDLLPTAVIPLTSVITIIKYGDKEEIRVVFQDQHEEKIKLKDLPHYVTETKNPKNEKGVDKVVITYPSDFLKLGLEIVDTPGVGSIYQHNTDVAYQFVPKADAGIFVVTADPPISDSELKFLQLIKDYLAKIIFVQNKIDQVEEKERQESLKFSKKVIEDTVGTKNLQFCQVSAKTGSGIREFQLKLKDLLISKKEQILELSAVRKLGAVINELQLQLGIQKQALAMSTQELKEKIEVFKEESEKIKQEKEDNSFILNGQAEHLTKKVLIEDIEALKENKLPELLMEYEKFFSEKKHLNGRELDREFDNFLKKLIKKTFNEWRKAEEQKLSESLETIITRFSDQTNRCIQKIIDLSSSLFNLKLKTFQTDSSLVGEIEFKFVFDEYEVDLDLYTPIITRLPKFLSNKILYNKMKDDILQEFDRHSGRVRYDFNQRILKSIYDYQNKLDETIESIISGIGKALSKALLEKEKKEYIQNSRKSDLIKNEEELNDLERKLEKILKILEN